MTGATTRCSAAPVVAEPSVALFGPMVGRTTGAGSSPEAAPRSGVFVCDSHRSAPTNARTARARRVWRSSCSLRDRARRAPQVIARPGPQGGVKTFRH